MTPEELHILRRRLRLTQAQFAERWGVSTSLVTSIELGRCRFTEQRQREVARIFLGLVHRLQKPARVEQASIARQVFSLDTLGDRPEPSRPAIQPVMRAGPLTEFDRCEWGGCSGETPRGMLYCAQHMALALVAGRPTRRA